MTTHTIADLTTAEPGIADVERRARDPATEPDAVYDYLREVVGWGRSRTARTEPPLRRLTVRESTRLGADDEGRGDGWLWSSEAYDVGRDRVRELIRSRVRRSRVA